jgi:hypothetical protein
MSSFLPSLPAGLTSRAELGMKFSGARNSSMALTNAKDDPWGIKYIGNLPTVMLIKNSFIRGELLLSGTLKLPTSEISEAKTLKRAVERLAE